MKQWEVKVPIAGHAIVLVEAEDEESAIDKAIEAVTLDDIETWEAVAQFNQGNICYCPQPWEAEAEDVSDED